MEPSKPVSQRPQNNRATPRFSGLGGAMYQRASAGVVNFLKPRFQNIVEIFLWTFLAQDVIAMWLPRIRGSLVRGAIHYDPKTDPDNKGLTPGQLFKKTVSKNFMGFNWPNFWEETMREVVTGPGILAVPTLVFSLARRGFGKTASELSYGPLTQLSDTFIQYLPGAVSLKAAEKTSAGKTPVTTETGFKKLFTSWMSGNTANGGKKAVAAAGDKLTEEAYRGKLKQFITDIVGTPEMKAAVLSDGSKKTYGEMIEAWAEKWVDTVFKANQASTRATQKSFDGAFDALQKEFVDLAKDYNNTYRSLHILQRREQMDEVWVSLLKRVKEKGQTAYGYQGEWTGANKLMEELRLWKDYALTVFKEHQGSWSDNLAGLAKKIYERLIVKKYLLATLGSLAAGIYLVVLTRVSQHSEHYVANRLLMADGNMADGNSASPAQGSHPQGPHTHAQSQQAHGDKDAQQRRPRQQETETAIASRRPVTTENGPVDSLEIPREELASFLSSLPSISRNDSHGANPSPGAPWGLPSFADLSAGYPAANYPTAALSYNGAGTYAPYPAVPAPQSYFPFVGQPIGQAVGQPGGPVSGQAGGVYPYTQTAYTQPYYPGYYGNPNNAGRAF